jgi:hypothetical protein
MTCARGRSNSISLVITGGVTQMVYLANNPYRSSDIYHHGIKGQRWGIRRFQNPDGTLTEEGKRRYSQNPGYIYRDKYGNLTDYGRKVGDKARSAYVNSGKDIVDYMEDEEKRVKELFDNAKDPKLRDPEFQKKILKSWSDALFEQYHGDVSTNTSLPASRLKTLRKLKKEYEDAEREVQNIRKEKRKNGLSFDLISDPAVIKAEKLYDRFREEDYKLSESIKMRTVNDIMRQITPEMRDTVYSMMQMFWTYD